MPDDTKKTDDLAIDPIDWFSIRGGWLHLDNHDRIKLASIRKYSCSDWDAFLYFENGDTYSVGTPDQSKAPKDLMAALDAFFFENVKRDNGVRHERN
jgi:hypothetical protein